jgi:hypothetical protein
VSRTSIELSVCCAALLSGDASAVDPEPHVPGLLAEVTAVFGVEGTRSDFEAVSPENRTGVIVTGGNVRRTSTRRSISRPFIEQRDR